MLQAIKGNKVLKISDDEVKRYQANGFDILSGGVTIAYGHGKTVPYEKFAQAEAQIVMLKAQLAAAKKAAPATAQTKATRKRR